ncbi:MAG: hypothetical protein ACYSTS_16430 [Planctomycetota bacterium]|jgi:hypothetical protein
MIRRNVIFVVLTVNLIAIICFGSNGLAANSDSTPKLLNQTGTVKGTVPCGQTVRIFTINNAKTPVNATVTISDLIQRYMLKEILERNLKV